MMKILVAPHPALKKKALPVTAVDDEIRQILDQMLDTMYQANGIGLAAPQVGISKRMLVMDVAETDEAPAPMKLINPIIRKASDESENYEEGCLSFPKQYALVKRPKAVTVDYVDIDGKDQTLEADGLLAICVQHEIDHLDGVNFVDHISRIRRDMIMRRLKKIAS
ncbi:MAG: peptide deformylase [Alphaproteobacteria bacterium]